MALPYPPRLPPPAHDLSEPSQPTPPLPPSPLASIPPRPSDMHPAPRSPALPPNPDDDARPSATEAPQPPQPIDLRHHRQLIQGVQPSSDRHHSRMLSTDVAVSTGIMNSSTGSTSSVSDNSSNGSDTVTLVPPMNDLSQDIIGTVIVMKLTAGTAEAFSDLISVTASFASDTPSSLSAVGSHYGASSVDIVVVPEHPLPPGPPLNSPGIPNSVVASLADPPGLPFQLPNPGSAETTAAGPQTEVTHNAAPLPPLNLTSAQQSGQIALSAIIATTVRKAHGAEHPQSKGAGP